MSLQFMWLFFFCKQKTAYEMRISDWSSDVFSSDLTPGYHSTGRSAAFYEECYGGPGILPLTKASGQHLREHGFLSPRGALYLARTADEAAVEAFITRFAETDARFERNGREELARIVPGIMPEWDRANRQPPCADLDVAGTPDDRAGGGWGKR